MELESEKLKKIAELIFHSKHLVAFTGAGISTDSGLSDYRGPEGVWTRKDKGLKPLAGPSITEVSPNAGHYVLQKLHEIKILKFIISQNVDNLHNLSGIPAQHLAELHGNYSKLKCLECDSRYTKKETNWRDEIFGKGYRKEAVHKNQPKCSRCNGRLISSIVNFGDPMPESEMKLATQHSRIADVFLVVGSSLVVQPAASLPMECFKNGGDIIIINMGKTPLDHIATIKLDTPITPALQIIFEKIEKLW